MQEFSLCIQGSEFILHLPLKMRMGVNLIMHCRSIKVACQLILVIFASLELDEEASPLTMMSCDKKIHVKVCRCPTQSVVHRFAVSGSRLLENRKWANKTSKS